MWGWVAFNLTRRGIAAEFFISRRGAEITEDAERYSEAVTSRPKIARDYPVSGSGAGILLQKSLSSAPHLRVR